MLQWMYKEAVPMAFIEYNPNPTQKRKGDCTVRAMCKALDTDWDHAFLSLCVIAMRMYDMPSANVVWGDLLHRNGFKKLGLPSICPECTTVSEFAKNQPVGVYVLMCENDHVVTVVDGDYYDTWDSGDSVVVCYFMKDEV